VTRRAVLALVVGLAAALAAWAPVAGGRSGKVRVICKTRSIDVYFWPHGHPYVKAYRFAAQKAPSLSVYRRGSVASRSFFVFLSARAFNYANTCDLAPNPLPTRWAGGRRTTVTATRRVRCTFPVVVQIEVLPHSAATGSDLRVLRGASSAELMRGRIAAKGSSLTFDARYCAASRVPGVS
jgi:hypothetical protein